MTPRAPHDPHVPCVPRGVDGVLSSEERGGLGSANEAKAPPAPRSRPLPWQGRGASGPLLRPPMFTSTWRLQLRSDVAVLSVRTGGHCCPSCCQHHLP